MNPYLLLRVPPDANDRTIRDAYLRAVKETTPDTHPERFKAVSQAYDKIKDEPSRLKHALFNTEPGGESPLDAFIQHAWLVGPPQPLPFEAMKELLRQCAKT